MIPCFLSFRFSHSFYTLLHIESSWWNSLHAKKEAWAMSMKKSLFELFFYRHFHSSWRPGGVGEDNGAEICLKRKKNLLAARTIYFSLSLRFCFYRLKNFCGSIADTVGSKSNTLHIRYYAEASAINSSFAILYTAIREKRNQNGNTSIEFFNTFKKIMKITINY